MPETVRLNEAFWFAVFLICTYFSLPCLQQLFLDVSATCSPCLWRCPHDDSSYTRTSMNIGHVLRDARSNTLEKPPVESTVIDLMRLLEIRALRKLICLYSHQILFLLIHVLHYVLLKICLHYMDKLTWFWVFSWDPLCPFWCFLIVNMSWYFVILLILNFTI